MSSLGEVVNCYESYRGAEWAANRCITENLHWFFRCYIFELLRTFNNSAINEVGGYKENLLKIRGKALS